MVPTIPEEEFTELFSETDSDRQFVRVQPRGRMVLAGSRQPETPIPVILPISAIPRISTALTTPTPEVMETPTPAMSACHEAIQAAIDHALASCTNDEEIGAMKAYLLANSMLQLSTQ